MTSPYSPQGFPGQQGPQVPPGDYLPPPQGPAGNPYGSSFPPPPRQRIGLIVGVLAAVLVLVAGGVTAFVLIKNNGSSNQAVSAASSTTSSPLSASQGAASSTTARPTSTQSQSGEFSVGDCLTGTNNNFMAVDCGGSSAVLKIYQVIPGKASCTAPEEDMGGRFETDKNTYCVTLFVPQGQCVSLDTKAGKFLRLPSCASGQGVEQVVAIRSGQNVTADNFKDGVCSGLPNIVDAWAYDAIDSGQFECLSSVGS